MKCGWAAAVIVAPQHVAPQHVAVEHLVAELVNCGPDGLA